jgi:eukaryotic-like serine/threonine-protein kinase
VDVGQVLSHYKILEKLGEGGMGVVYKAQDLRLDRLVALKLLPRQLLFSEEEVGRFQQEAKAISSLNHPNIATIYDVGQADGQKFLVLEYLPGGTLKSKVKQAYTSGNALSLPEIVRYALQTARGLAHSHRHGIIHRDVKTENLMLSEEGNIKITDFGLAKLKGGAGLTKSGSAVGTAAYMSPEQFRGEEIDLRSDIFSFGIVLYELMTGSLPFRGEHEAALSYSIVNETPIPIKSLRPDVPPALEQIIDRCLEKDKEKRFQSVEDIVNELQNLRQATTPGASQAENRSQIGWITVAGVAILAVIVYLLIQSKKSSAPQELLHVKLAQETIAEGTEEYPAWSPDGAFLAYSGDVKGYNKIFVKNVATGEDSQVTKGSTDDIQPAWSNDNKQLLFVRSHQPNGKLEPGDIFGQYDGGDIWMIDLATENETRFIENAFDPAYSPDGERIAFDASWAGPRRIWTVDNRGRNPKQLSSDISDAVAHIMPKWSPDGSKIVFQNIERTKFDLKIVNVGSGGMTSVTDDLFRDISPIWSRSGNAIYFSSDRSGGLNLWRIPVSSNGSAAGLPQQLTTGAGQDVQVAIAPDGKRLAFSILKLNADIWELPFSPDSGKPTGSPQEVIATTREDSRGAWSPDGSMIAFNSDRGDDMNIWVYTIRDKSTRQLTNGAGGDFQPNWSPDGKLLAFFSTRAGNPDIWTVDLGTGELKQLTRNTSVEINPIYSPDGSSIGFQSDASGRLEPWVMKSDGSDQRRLATMEVTGHFMRWLGDGTFLIFKSPNPSQPGLWSAPLAGGDPVFFAVVQGGSHMSFSPRYDAIMDVVGHKELWLNPLKGGAPAKVFHFDDPESRIDYPVWSPDGKWILFDRVKPLGGDIWIMEGIE